MFANEKLSSRSPRKKIRPFLGRMLTFKNLFTPMNPFSRKFSLRFYQFVLTAFFAAFLSFGFHATATAQEDETQNAVAAFNEGQNLHEKGDLAGAIKLYERALNAVPEFPEAAYQRGIAYLALGRSDEAESSFRKASGLRADWTLALTSLASILIQRDELGEAEKILQKVVDLEPQNPPALAALSELRLRSNAAPATLQELLTKITVLTSKANPTASLWSARAALENALGKRNAAKSSLAGALAVDPKNATALFQVADIALAEGDPAKANEIALRLENTSANADRLKLLKANILAQESKTDDALKQLDSIQRPDAAAADLRMRINAAKATNPADLERQLETDAKNPLILGRLCSLYRRDDPAKALAYCRRASEMEPQNINHAVGFGAALVQAKQFDAAIKVLRKLIQIAPDNTTAHANLATALFQLKRYSEAKPEFLWLTLAQPKSPAAYYFLGITHDHLTEYIDALANYHQYLRLADPVAGRLEIEKVNLRLPSLEKLIKAGKGRK